MGGPIVGDVLVQSSAHGMPHPELAARADGGDGVTHWRTPERAIAPGQSVVFYDPTDTFVLGGGIAT